MKYPTYPAYTPSGVEWLGDVPEGWVIRRLKMTARSITKKPNIFIPEAYIGLEHVQSSIGKLVDMWEPSLALDEDMSGGKIFEGGDILFGKLRPYLAKVWSAIGEGICSSEFLVLRSSHLFSNYLKYLILSRSFIDTVNASTFGSKMPRAEWEFIGNMTIPIPPLAEQRTIAAFLDRETAKIDALITKQEQMIALLREKRQATISHAVTKGLDTDAPMKASGVEYTGYISDSFQILPLRRVINKFVDYRGATPVKTLEGVPLITAKNIKQGAINLDLSREYIDYTDYDKWMVRGFPKQGDVLLTTEAPLGETAQITNEYIALAQRVILLKPNPKKISGDYLKWYFLSHEGYTLLFCRATGSTALGIKASHLRDVEIVVPTLAEQRAIVAYLDRETATIDALIDKQGQMIALLQEHRAALITAVVTGKIDVREAAERESEQNKEALSYAR